MQKQSLSGIVCNLLITAQILPETTEYPVDKFIVGNCGEYEINFILLPLKKYT